MKRNVHALLTFWKNSQRRKPLIINGARQVGTTYSLKHFEKTEYENTVYFNFEKDGKLGRYFEESLDPQQVIKIKRTKNSWSRQLEKVLAGEITKTQSNG